MYLRALLKLALVDLLLGQLQLLSFHVGVDVFLDMYYLSFRTVIDVDLLRFNFFHLRTAHYEIVRIRIIIIKE